MASPNFERGDLIQTESIESFMNGIEFASQADQLSFLVHELFNGQAASSDQDSYVSRRLEQNIGVGYESYRVSVIEWGQIYSDGVKYQIIRVERQPIRLSKKGSYRVDLAYWEVGSSVEVAHVGHRMDKISRLGRERQGKEQTISHADVLSKNEWVEETLLAMRKHQNGGFDG